MNKYNETDLVGKKFGKLTIIKLHGYNKYKQALWECKCDCGDTRIVLFNLLKNGTITCCNKNKHNKDFLIGKKFGMLTVLELVSENKQILLKCKCDCGNICLKNYTYLQQVKNASCGCFNDLTGKRFGRLTVIKNVGVHKTRAQKIWLCKCDCGNEVIRVTDDLKRSENASCGCYITKSRQKLLKNNAKIKNFKKKNFVDNTCLHILKNKKPFANNKLGARGVIYNERAKLYFAYLYCQHQQISLGYYKNLEDAIKAHERGVEKYFEPILKKHAKIKKCKVCGKEFESKNSLHLYCSKECKIKQNVLDSAKYRRDYSKKYQEKNKEKISNYNKQRYKTLDKEKVKKHNRDYYIKNKDKIREKYQEYRLSYYKSHYIKKSKNP